MSKNEPSLMETLPDETRLKIRSTQNLTSLPQIVSELFQNSLDAGALTIDTGFDLDNGSCWVKDDGCGINRDGLQQLALEGEQGRYSTIVHQSSDSCIDKVQGLQKRTPWIH